MVTSGTKRAEEETKPADATPVRWDSNLERVLEQWRLRAWASQVAHYQVAEKLRKRNRELGLPVVILTTVVGTSLFATLNEDTLPMGTRIAVGGISLLAAIFAASQSFFGFAQRADQHVLAADWYSAIRRRIEQTQGLPRTSRGDARECLDSLRKEMNHVGSQFPEIGEKTWSDVARRFGIEEPSNQTARGSAAPAERVTLP